MRRPRPLVSRPVAFQSGARAVPMPKAGSIRPPLSTSIVAHCLASSSGSRSATRGHVHAEFETPRGAGERRQRGHTFENGVARNEPVCLPQRVDPRRLRRAPPSAATPRRRENGKSASPRPTAMVTRASRVAGRRANRNTPAPRSLSRAMVRPSSAFASGRRADRAGFPTTAPTTREMLSRPLPSRVALTRFRGGAVLLAPAASFSPVRDLPRAPQPPGRVQP